MKPCPAVSRDQRPLTMLAALANQDQPRKSSWTCLPAGRNLQDQQDDASYRRCEFIRTQSPEPAGRQANEFAPTSSPTAGFRIKGVAWRFEIPAALNSVLRDLRACEETPGLLRTPLDAVGGVAGTPKIESFSAAGLPDFVHPRALPTTPRDALATAGGVIHKL